MNQLSDRLRRRTVRGLDDRETTGSLAALQTGSRALIVGLTQTDTPLARRLCDLGFTPGTWVEALRRAPLGDPVVYRLRDFELCLRAREARVVEVAAPDRVPGNLAAGGTGTS